MRHSRLRRWLLRVGLLFLALFIFAVWPARRTFTVSPETTYVTGPLDDNGFVDYPKALNLLLSDGITPENNANVLIIQALGPKPDGARVSPEYYQWLGITEPPEEGDYFISWDKYYRANLKPAPQEEFDPAKPAVNWNKRWDDEASQAGKWPWKTSEHPELAHWLRENEKPLALIAEATKRPHYFNPLVAKNPEPQSFRLISSLLPSVQRCRSVAQALACRAMARVAEGDHLGAWNDLMTCQRLGRLVGRGATLIEGLVGIAIVQIAMNAQTTFLSQGKHASKQVLAWSDKLRHLPAMPPLADRLDRAERFMMMDILMTMVCRGTGVVDKLDDAGNSGPIQDDSWLRFFSFSIDYDSAFRIVNDYFDRVVAASRIPDRFERKQELEILIEEIKKMKQEAGTTPALTQAQRGEGVGKILLTLMLPAYQKIQDAVDRTVQAERNQQVAFALEAYRADRGHYPAKLDELAPEYIAKIPDDLFSGLPLIYQKTEKGYLLYSVGVNEMDDGGTSSDDRPRGDDIRVRMPAERPAE